jgi:hypothetical protein
LKEIYEGEQDILGHIDSIYKDDMISNKKKTNDTSIKMCRSCTFSNDSYLKNYQDDLISLPLDNKTSDNNNHAIENENLSNDNSSNLSKYYIPPNQWRCVHDMQKIKSEYIKKVPIKSRILPNPTSYSI